jgi:hypothetical protein
MNYGDAQQPSTTSHVLPASWTQTQVNVQTSNMPAATFFDHFFISFLIKFKKLLHLIVF